MKKVVQTVLGLAGVALVLTGCGGNQVAENSTSVAQQGEATVAVEGTDGQTNSSAPSQDVAASPPALPVPSLIPPTTPGDRLPTVTVGRNEPFGAIADAPIVRRRVSIATAPSSAAPAATVVPTPAPSPQITTVPLSNQPLPILPSVPVEAPGTTVAVNPSTIPVSPLPTSLAHSIEVSGVIEAGGTVSAIVQVPGEPTSRSVNAGDYLAGGSVLVKRIDVAGEPVVILEQDGIEVVRSVGSSAIAGAL
ncbi:MAG: hypothetical protein HC840_24525 [Leptolyngbyaceae cyanobacterium RM2_2_4]|nr:hypothetical protein [Leptolyngbyaceae cyanobacterium SM1_4_3]NJN89404.1 hypothetical protein [Leptolyngbyaceae cyanobacterium SL_5_14]NJO52048.1 hypothetical protein [Leptolyngbyaceae cyanobacterium RM2_2_4]